MARAEELAGGRAVSIFGAQAPGRTTPRRRFRRRRRPRLCSRPRTSDVARQVLALGRLDEIIVQIVPLVLGGGVRLFGEAPTPRVALERTYVGTSGTLTDIRFRITCPTRLVG
jgi:hypothetical protein